MSAVESTANVVIGYGVALATQLIVLPLMGFHATLATNLKIGAIFTAVSWGRSFLLRRFFNGSRFWRFLKTTLDNH